ncbi:KpsF/GutQ family sugar-phosphate isomerase [Curvivirga sp.]|uniref:KpsF/GutQ family sugar-phosphate isomerase n=1 Tax=Curvivirga sp. TaxID=2856848 RepID=UPI003B58F5A3
MSDQKETDVNAGRRVLTLESEALQSLSDSLNGDFSDAVTLLFNVKGRVIISGMGKSGHIGRKIAATMASTGTPAQFVHPGEASHGDLGMITNEDAVIAISNSGETKELSDLIYFAKRFSIPMIGITSKAGSTLAKNSDIPIILPAMPEAATMGLAPTTSTTMTLALGDALSVALMERKGFTAQDFHTFHPGGKLGQQLLRVEDLMHDSNELPLCSSGTKMRDAIVIMAEKRFGCVGITDNQGNLSGIVTDGDLRRHMAPNLLDQSADSIMTPNPITITPSSLAAEALTLMNESKITAVFVTDGKKPVGIAHVHDFLRAGVV